MTTGFLIGILPVLIVVLLVQRFVVRRRRAQALDTIHTGLDAHLSAQSLALSCAHESMRQLQARQSSFLFISDPAEHTAPEMTTPDTANGIGGSGGGEHRDSQGSNPGVDTLNVSTLVGSHNPPVAVRGKLSGGALVALDCTVCGENLIPHLSEALVRGCPTCRRRRSIALVPLVSAMPAAVIARIA